MFGIGLKTFSALSLVGLFLLGASTVLAEPTREIISFKRLSCSVQAGGEVALVRNIGSDSRQISKLRKILRRTRKKIKMHRARIRAAKIEIRYGGVVAKSSRRKIKKVRQRMPNLREKRAFLSDCNKYIKGILPIPVAPPVNPPAGEDPADSEPDSPPPPIDSEPEHLFYVCPNGAGLGDGSSAQNPLSLNQALLHSASNPDMEITYRMLDGLYSGFEDLIERSKPHTFSAQNSGEVYLEEPVALLGSNFYFIGFSLDVYVGESRDEFGVHLTGDSNLVADCVIKGEGRYAALHPRSVGVKLSGSNNTVKACDISEANSSIGGGGSGHTLIDNNLHTTTQAPIRVANLSSSIIEGNSLHNASRCTPAVLWCNEPDKYPMPEWDVSKYLGSCEIEECPNGGVTGYPGNGPHPNLLSARALDNVIIRGNRGWDGQIPTLRIRDGFGGEPNGKNIIVENNIFPQFFALTGELTVRNNIFGTATFGASTGASSPCSVKEFSLNIVGGFSYSNGGSVACTDFEFQGYNLIQWQSCRAGFSCDVGESDHVLGDRWGDYADWDDFFVDYQGLNNLSNFQLKPGSLPIDLGPVDRGAELDSAGSSRVEISDTGGEFPFVVDAGVYEYR